MLIAPSEAANKIPPARQRITFINVELRGLIIDTIINRSIPPPKEPQSASHLGCPRRKIKVRYVITKNDQNTNNSKNLKKRNQNGK